MPDAEKAIQIMSSKKSFVVWATSAAECQDWKDAILREMRQLRKNNEMVCTNEIKDFDCGVRRDIPGKGRRSGRTNLYLSLLNLLGTQVTGVLAPIWTPDSAVPACMNCCDTFTTISKRRHHCRKCGNAVCGPCSTHRFVRECIVLLF